MDYLKLFCLLLSLTPLASKVPLCLFKEELTEGEVYAQNLTFALTHEEEVKHFLSFTLGG